MYYYEYYWYIAKLYINIFLIKNCELRKNIFFNSQLFLLLFQKCLEVSKYNHVVNNSQDFENSKNKETVQ